MFHVERLSKDEWMGEAIKCHTDLFSDEGLDESLNLNFAVVLKDENNVINHYLTVQEIDSETAHIPYGGSLAQWRNLGRGPEGFIMMLNELKRNYKRATFWTKFTNRPMIMLALKVGFQIIGTREAHGVPGLEFLIEF
jgi:hypothetical protein